MKRSAFALLLLPAGCVTAPPPPVPAATIDPAEAALAARNPAVGGVAMPGDRTIGQAVATAPPLAMLSRAVASSDVSAMLQGVGPVTLFAPTDEAFARLQPGTSAALLLPENRDTLDKMIRLHLVAGRLTSADLMRRVFAGGGRATLFTLSGEPLLLTVTGTVLTLTDVAGDKSYVETADVRQTNGVLHVVNGVLVPRIE